MCDNEETTIKNIVREGDIYREQYRDGFDALVKRLEAEGNIERERFMPADILPEKLGEYRRKYHEMLGLHKLASDGLPIPQMAKMCDDGDVEIRRVTVPITPELSQYGLLFVPHGIKKAPLVIAQHGGSGTPELCADLNGNNNYNHMVKRLLKRKAAVFAPQLLLWSFGEAKPANPSHPIPFNRNKFDKDLKRFGLSITAVEIKGIMNAITFLSTLDLVDSESIGMTGLSYGGYFTLHTMAADSRIKAGFSNACFNDRNVYPWNDWTYTNSGNTFHDAEVAALCAPRKLYVAVGKEDTVFDYKSAVSEAERVHKYFDAFGCPENFVFTAWNGGHTLPDADEGIDFMFSAF